MSKYTIADVERAITFLKKECNAMYIRIEIDELGRMLIKASDKGGDGITITIFDESTAKMAEVTRTTRL